MMRLLIATILSTATLLGPLRAEEQRPKIGVVLGGGGALGLAHVGVLQVLEELQIPIDYIAGTSMGAIVAGMYASGMSPDEIERQLTSLDWWEVLRDQSPRRYLTYRRKTDNKRFLGAEFGLQDWKIVFPPGMSYGQKLNNVLETFSINSAGITDFDQLNIPYRAVATDLRSGTSVTLSGGSLAHAMRASMAVPGVFTPIRMDGMVLMDGGIINNIPVEVVKEMGADIILAVDVVASAAARNGETDFNKLGDVVARTYHIVQRPDQERQLALADVVIAPDLTGFSPSQFHKDGEIIPRGRTAAEEVVDRLGAYSVDRGTYAAYVKKQRRKNSEKIEITAVHIDGNEAVSETTIRKRIRTAEGPLQLETVYDDLNRIHGMGLFQSVTYDLSPDAEGYALEYNAKEKFWGPTYLHFGMKLETATDASMIWSLLFNSTRTQLNPLGGEVRVDLEGGGQKRSLSSEWYQPITPSGVLFLAPSIILSDENIDVYQGDDVVADVDQQLAYGSLDAGISAFEFGELRVGVLGGYANDSGNAGFSSLESDDDSVVAATTHLYLDQLNDPIFPTSGFRLGIDGLFADEEMGSSETFNRLEATAVLPISMGRHTITPRFSAGSSLGTDLPFYALFDLGGLDQFAGYAPYQVFGNYYGVASLGYRYRLGRLPPTLGNGIYAQLRVDAGNAWLNREDVSFDNINYGYLAGIAADTIIGTCSIAVGKAESLNPRFYFSIGNAF